HAHEEASPCQREQGGPTSEYALQAFSNFSLSTDVESMVVMTVIVCDVRKGHSAPFHRYQTHSTVSAFDPTNRAAARFIRSNEFDTHMHYVDDYVA
ncbi:hypothetical protein H257_18798, partial [Aphanomyces astaci]